MAGSLDQPQGTNVIRKIKFVDVSLYSPSQIETYFNDNLGNSGWQIKQVILDGAVKYLLAEKVE